MLEQTVGGLIMERLTTKVCNVYQTNDKFTPLLGIKRLGEYEDTGLTPEEIEDLKIELESMRSAANSLKMHYKKAKSEAIKEFGKIKEKLKHYLETNEENGVVYIPKFVVENILKEMTEARKS